jgi:hypothetical protein
MISKFSVFIIVIVAVTGLNAVCPEQNNPTDAPAPNPPTEAPTKAPTEALTVASASVYFA